MKTLIAISLALLGCGTDTGADPGADASGGTNVSGHITASATWSGTVNITAATIIDPGVTITVMAGTTMRPSASVAISVQGTLDVQGTSAGKVVLAPTTTSTRWGGVQLPAGGQLLAHYLDEVGGGYHLSGGSASLFDSTMSRMSGDDLLTMGGGTLDVEYSSIGLEPGMTDSTHCDMHFSGANVIKVTHTNLSTASYGLEFYGGQNADFTYTNWFSNAHDVATQTGSPVSGDFSFSWFERAAPTGIGITATNLATARLADAGPRP